jgi:hypothetical protein
MMVEKWDGAPISRPGLYSGIPMSAYHSGKLCIGPSISSSGLRTIFGESEAHFFDGYALNPNCAPRVESEAFTLGRATHHLLLGENFFARDFVVRPEKAPDGRAWNGNNLTCQKWIDEQKSAGRTVLSGIMVEKIKGMAVSLGKEPLVRAGALNGLIETTMAWPDKETGVWLLARPDVIPTDSGDYCDLKTTASVQYRDLVRSLGEYGYHQQGALVRDGHRILFGQDISSFSNYFIESTRPYCARLMQLKIEDLDLGAQQNRNALRRFVAAMNSGEWPGPGGRQDAVQYVEIGDKKREYIEARLKFEGTD